jgi:nucleotide-binding universal stress UspA family protein
MSRIKKIAVHVEGGAQDTRVLRLAGALAARFGAAIEAVFAMVPAYIPATIAAISTPQIIEAQRAIYLKRAETAKKTLASTMMPQQGAVWTQVEAQVADAIVARGRYADLTVLGQPEETDVAAEYDVPADVAMSLGRPILMVPYAGSFSDAGKRVLVAWNGTRESARALSDALPFLADASEITILAVNPRAQTEAMEADLEAWLAAHGLAGKTRAAHTNEIGVADVLLSAAADASADLLVMGAYGRSRLRELILGGVTHDIFRRMTIPVLMSH